MSIIREGNHNRAWNDPPKLAHGTSEPRGRIQLNKRVMYTPGISTLPTMPVTVQDPSSPAIKNENFNVFTPSDSHPGNCSPPYESPPTFAGKVDTSEVPNMNSSDMLKKVHASLIDMLSKAQEKISARKLEDIKRRLEIMESQWLAEKLSEQTKKLMYLLGMKLRNRYYDEAARIQVALVVNFPCEVSQWIMGVKHVILGCQSQNKL